MHRVDLPLELWHEIFQYLQHSQHQAVLAVSRMFHDVAIRFLFSAVKIYFTAWKADDGRSRSPSLFVRDQHQSELLLNISWEILDHIVENPSFAQVVRKVIVYASAEEGQAVFEQRELES
jgi:hypothetical protein